MNRQDAKTPSTKKIISGFKRDLRLSWRLVSIWSFGVKGISTMPFIFLKRNLEKQYGVLAMDGVLRGREK
jgi:hypothetical protein